MSTAWFTWYCVDCGFPIVVQPSQELRADYACYCSNLCCDNHSRVEHIGDLGQPSYAAATQAGGTPNG